MLGARIREKQNIKYLKLEYLHNNSFRQNQFYSFVVI